jgi:hypothetical protein
MSQAKLAFSENWLCQISKTNIPNFPECLRVVGTKEKFLPIQNFRGHSGEVKLGGSL